VSLAFGHLPVWIGPCELVVPLSLTASWRDCGRKARERRDGRDQIE
jgi:hypothetical protein